MRKECTIGEGALRATWQPATATAGAATSLNRAQLQCGPTEGRGEVRTSLLRPYWLVAARAAARRLLRSTSLKKSSCKLLRSTCALDGLESRNSGARAGTLTPTNPRAPKLRLAIVRWRSASKRRERTRTQRDIRRKIRGGMAGGSSSLAVKRLLKEYKEVRRGGCRACRS